MSGPLAGCRLAPVPGDAAAGYAAGLLTGLGAGAGPHLLTVAAAPDSGPVADWAASGAMALTGPAQGPPLVAPGRPATGARGALLALAALTGQDFGFDGHRLLGERAALAGLTPAAPWSAGGSCRAVRSADGWVAVSWARAADDELLPALVEREVHGPAWPVLDAWARDRTSAEVVARATLLGLCLAEIPAAVQEPAAAQEPIAQEPIAQEPIAQEPVAPGPAAPWRLSGAAGTRTGLPPGALVVDLSALWAGPLCGHLLGLAGARVLRVESSTRPDGGRRGAAGFDDLLHAGQESVALDVTAAQGRAALRTLVDRADVVLTSARPRALDQLGLDPDAWLRSRTDGCWVSITAHPDPHRVGFGDDAAMSAGLVRWSPTGAPVPCGDALGDPLTGLHAAVAAAAGLWAGGRHRIELSLHEVARSLVGPVPGALVHPDGGGWLVEAEHGWVPVRAPQARPATGRARPLGADTRAVLRRFTT